MAIVLLVILSSCAAAKLLRLKFNDTPSMPIGFYQRLPTKHISVGSIVSVCLPKNIADFGMQRGYITHGHCPSGSIALIKKVIAVPHDNVLLNNQSIIVNGQHYWAPTHRQDPQGHTIKQFVKHGRHPNTKLFWLYGANDPNLSWDSRYYGGVSRSSITGVWRPWLTF